MANLPNLKHSKLLNSLCSKFHMSDPFRCLNPTKKDFTFIPREKNKTNRSRLDFFIISDCLIPSAESCEIAPSLQSSLFDHKAVLLSFKKTATYNSRPSISNLIVGEPLTEPLVALSVAECYLHHYNPEDQSEKIWKNRCLQEIGVARSRIRLLTPSDEHNPLLDSQNTIINETIQNINFKKLESLVLDIDNDIFLEYLILCVRNDVISYQTFHLSEMKKRYTQLCRDLNELKKDYVNNQIRINDIEKEVELLANKKINVEVEKYRLFEHLNSEKITPF